MVLQCCHLSALTPSTTAACSPSVVLCHCPHVYVTPSLQRHYSTITDLCHLGLSMSVKSSTCRSSEGEASQALCRPTQWQNMHVSGICFVFFSVPPARIFSCIHPLVVSVLTCIVQNDVLYPNTHVVWLERCQLRQRSLDASDLHYNHVANSCSCMCCPRVKAAPPWAQSWTKCLS